MSNTLKGITAIKPTVQAASYQELSSTEKENEIENDFSQILLNNLSSLSVLDEKIRNVPLGYSSLRTISNKYNNYNSSLDESTSSKDILSSINKVDKEENNKINSGEFRVKIDAKDENTKNRIANAVKKASTKYNVDPNLILAVIRKESYFNPNTTSSSGAMGLMQIMPKNASYLGVKNAYNIEENIDGGTKLLKEYIDRYNGDIEMALMAYNGGPTRMAQRGVKSVSDLYKMPKETQKYVPTVMKFYRGEE